MYRYINITIRKDILIFRMIENNETEKTEEIKKSSHPETNGTAAKPECTNSVQVPVSFVEQVRAEDTNCFRRESTTTCTSLRIWLG